MINKLLANLPFSPSLIGQIGFYAKRLKDESSIRRAGVIMLVLSMIAQSFVAISPSEKSLASSDMNLINGVKTRDDIIDAWNKRGSDIPSIYGYFGVTLEDIKNLPKNPNVTLVSNDKDYWSVGRKPISGVSTIDPKFKKQEITIEIDSNTTVYMRPIRAWDIQNPSNTYRAFQGVKKSDGQRFWVVVDCGNYIQIGKPKPKPPQLEIKKTVTPKSDLNPGETVKFRIEYRNKVSGTMAENAVIEDQLDLAKFDIIKPRNLTIYGNVMKYKLGDLGYSKTSRVLDITARLKTNLKNKQKICNTATIDADNADKVKSTDCTNVTVEQTIPPGNTKSVRNITQNLDDEQILGAKVRPGDVLEYTLTTTNTNNTDRKNYTIRDYIGDILDYADLDMAYLASQGGTFSKDLNEVVWPNQTLRAKSDTVKSFRVKIKNPVPSTNSPSSITPTFDCKISNEYGDELTLNIECPIVKNIEKLPDTGPGETLAAAFMLTAIASYFLMRSRLLTKELEIVRHGQAAQGGKL